jgi:hypothetical protein
MKVLVLYRPNSEHARTVEEYVRDFQARHSAPRLEILNIDTREGIATATLYDVVEYPAFLVTQDDGSVQRAWIGEQMPLMDEIAAYATL